MNGFKGFFFFLIFFLSMVVCLNFIYAGEIMVYSDQGVEKLTFPDLPPLNILNENWELKGIECIYNCDKKEVTSQLSETTNVEEEKKLEKNIPTNIYLSVNIVPPAVIQPMLMTSIWPIPYYYNIPNNSNIWHRFHHGFDNHVSSKTNQDKSYYPTTWRYQHSAFGSRINPNSR